MNRLLLAGAALATAALPAAGASAATIFTPTASGYLVYGSQTGTGTYTDTFSFITTIDEMISGSFSTQALFDGATELSDLDITSITFNGAALRPGTGNTDASEAYYLPSTSTTAGTQTLEVTYNVDNAAVAPSYSGTLTLASAVPEPATWAMLGAGFGMIGFGFQRRNRASLAQAV